MKQVTVVILSVIYLAFTFTGVGHAPVWEPQVYAPATPENVAVDQSKELKKGTEAQFLKAVKNQKAANHLAGSGKVKLSRPGFSSFYSPLSAVEPAAGALHHLRTGTPVWSSNTLYLHNCTFIL